MTWKCIRLHEISLTRGYSVANFVGGKLRTEGTYSALVKQLYYDN